MALPSERRAAGSAGAVRRELEVRSTTEFRLENPPSRDHRTGRDAQTPMDEHPSPFRAVVPWETAPGRRGGTTVSGGSDDLGSLACSWRAGPREDAVKEIAKTTALVVLGFLYVVLALHRPEIPKPEEHPVELNPAFIALKNELAKSKEALAAAQAELKAYKAAVAAAAAEKEREAKWTAAAEAEARGALRTASKLYDDYAKNYPESKQAPLAARKAKKLLADFEAAKASPSAATAAVPTATP